MKGIGARLDRPIDKLRLQIWKEATEDSDYSNDGLIIMDPSAPLYLLTREVGLTSKCVGAANQRVGSC